MYGVHAVVGRGHGVCPLVGGCPLVGVSIIGGSTVYLLSDAILKPFSYHRSNFNISSDVNVMFESKVHNTHDSVFTYVCTV